MSSTQPEPWGSIPDAMLMKTLFRLIIITLLTAEAGRATVTAFLPTRYRGRYQSPFLPGIQAGTIEVEDFEDLGEYDHTRLNIVGGLRTSGSGVDEDKPGLDFDGRRGIIWDVDNFGGTTINFLPGTDGRYPQYAGFAILGYDVLDSGEFNLVNVYAPGGTDLYPGGLRRYTPIFPPVFPASYSAIGDEFVGFYSSEGIGSLHIQKGFFDHLQWGFIPEPGTPLLLATGLLAATRRRRSV